jgi:LuxR family transcriptional regulator, maltose regulon positive regulatory protein
MLAPILRTKIIPPPPRNVHILSRPRLNEALQQALDYRLTIMQAGAGYGKSTALADFAQIFAPLAWYQVNEDDNDPPVFLQHLIHAIRYAIPDIPNLPIETLDHWDGTSGPLPWQIVIDQLINALSEHLSAPVLLVFDDAHLITRSGEIPLVLDRLVGRGPAFLHTLISGRPLLDLPSLHHWRNKGELHFLDQATLAFNAEEIAALYLHHYHLDLMKDEVEDLLRYTEGWAIALQLVWQSIRSQPTWKLPRHWTTDSLDSLFDVLAREVFYQQGEDVREFLLTTASLRELIPAACNYLRGSHDSTAMLAHLRRQHLFVTETAGGVLRYHPIFHDFLRQQAAPDRREAWHLAAADYFLNQDNPEAALYHLLEIKQWERMADLLDSYAAILLAAGRLDTLDAYLASLPPETLQQHPRLLFTLGELARLHSRFDEARGWYEQAEAIWRVQNQPDGIARALRGRARVYLDTVDPAGAERLLEEAVLIYDGSRDRETQVRLYELLAENKLNSGRVEDAERLLQRAEALRAEGPSNDGLHYRVMVRTGRLAEARHGLEKRAEAEKKKPVETPRAHRETMLLLSLIYSLMGLNDEACRTAREGTQRGDDLKSPFITAVGHMRHGHALMLSGGSEDFLHAREQYEKSIEISRTLDVPRLRVESGWGLCRSYGYVGDFSKAQQYAQEAIDIADEAGDEWIASLVRLTMGASLAMATRYEAAEEWLNRATLGFQECSDPFGRSVARLWLSLGHFKQERFERVAELLPEVLATCHSQGYDFLFTRPSFLGALDERIFVPLLLYARQEGWECPYVRQLLDTLGLPELELHPGYQLRVQTLGGFQVWHGPRPIPPNGWQREKSRQLFQLFLTYRQTPLDRDQICEFLWPEVDPATAQRNYKVALATLFRVLEPERSPGSESAFIMRDGSAYCLRPGADLWLDAEQFTQQVRRFMHSAPDTDALQNALRLYQGDYLPDTVYEIWTAEERERLAALFLETADRLAEMLLDQARYPEVIELCQRILTQDNCWERAYRHLMLAYSGLGDRGQVGRTYQRCLQTLDDELDVRPSPETEQLYQTLTI